MTKEPIYSLCMTEQKAMTKYCPIKLGPNLQTVLKGEELKQLLNNCLCVGSDCPKWIHVGLSNGEGYCS